MPTPVLPFGTIDKPIQGGVATRSSFANWGWVLAPQPNTIPSDGSTLIVFVDDQPIGNVTFGFSRPDIDARFPGLNNSGAGVGVFLLDTTAYANGVHTIAWRAEDDNGNSDGIGSRFFMIQN